MGVRIRVGVAVALCAAVAGCKDEVAAPAPVRPVMSVIVSSAEARNVVIVGSFSLRSKPTSAFARWDGSLRGRSTLAIR